MIILTVDYNSVTAPLYDNLKTISSVSAAQNIIDVMVAQSSLKVFSRGPFNTIEINAIKSGNWLDYMLRVPNSISNMMIQPLVYSVKDFNQARYKSANQFAYIKVCATPLAPVYHKIKIQLEYILNCAPVYVIVKTFSGTVVVSLLFSSSYNVFDLTSYLIDPVMTVVIRPTVSWGCPYPWSVPVQQVRAGFIVDGAYTYKLQVSCSYYCN
jgi:hypothetical protein